MNKEAITQWNSLSKADQQAIFNEVGAVINLPAAAVEKGLVGGAYIRTGVL